MCIGTICIIFIGHNQMYANPHPDQHRHVENLTTKLKNISIFFCCIYLNVFKSLMKLLVHITRQHKTYVVVKA